MPRTISYNSGNYQQNANKFQKWNKKTAEVNLSILSTIYSYSIQSTVAPDLRKLLQYPLYVQCFYAS